MNPALYEELTFSWKIKIANATFKHNIQKEMILNFDQTALGFTARNESTFTEKGAHSVTIANFDDKRCFISLIGKILGLTKILLWST